jgi:low temperature requirement protein LtrA
MVVLIFDVLFWMYAAYAWLTNMAPPDRPARRLLLMVGMAGFLFCALAVPRAFDSGGVAFGATAPRWDLDRTRRLCEQHGLVFPINQ